MDLKKLLSVIGVFLLTLITMVSCVKDTDYELPDLKESVPTFDGEVVDFEKIISAATAEVTEYTANQAFEGYVVSSDEGGNFYKKIYLQNEAKNKAVAIAIDKSGLYSEFPLGTKVQVRLKGLTTQINNGILEVGYQVHTASGGRKSVGNMPEVIYKKHVYNLQEDPKPQSELAQEVTALETIKNDAKLGQLITLKGVSFSKTDVGKKFHVKENDPRQGTDYTLRDAQGGTIKFRTSRYAKFINEAVPAGKLDITGVFTKFGSNYQFLINTLNDIKVVGNSDDNGGGSDNNQATLKTAQEIRALYSNADVTISEDWKIKVVITSDKEARNINEKNAYAQDQTAGIALRFDAAHGFAVGDEVEILLKDLKLSKFNNLLQIGGITQDKAKKTGTKTLTPQAITLEQALSGNFESQLVTISDVQFKNKGAKYKDANGNQLLTNCTQELTLYTAKNAVFADTPVSDKRGSVTGNLSVFKTTIQLIIRNVSDVNFTADYTDCSGGGTPAPNQATLKTTQEIRALYSNADVTISENWKIKVVITSDKEARNINEKNAYAQDQTAGIALRFDAAHNFAVGDEVEILLKDLKLSKFKNLLQISGITQDKANKIGTKPLTPQTITLEQALSGSFESQLVTISNVQFKNKDAKYKDANGSQLLTNCTQELTLYTARNAVFADNQVSDKRGDITGNLSVFETTIQLIIRNVNDVNFTADYTNCGGGNSGGGNSGGGNSGTQGGVFDFENVEAGASPSGYKTEGTITQNNATLTYKARTDVATYAINGKGLMLHKHNDNPYIKITFTNGVKNVKFKYKGAFTSGTNRTLKIYDGDESSTTELDTITFAKDVSGEKVMELNKTGNVTITFKSTDRQIVIDDIEWTE